MTGVQTCALPIWVGLMAQAGPPAVEVAGEGAGADHAEVVTFGEVFNGDDCIVHNFQHLNREAREEHEGKKKTNIIFS